jgi:hypothetical protein
MVITAGGGRDITIIELRRIQIIEDVFVLPGVGAARNASRLGFEAPRSN